MVNRSTHCPDSDHNAILSSYVFVGILYRLFLWLGPPSICSALDHLERPDQHHCIAIARGYVTLFFSLGAECFILDTHAAVLLTRRLAS